MTSTNTSRAIYVLGDSETAQRLDLLVVKAAEHGAVIGKAFSFEPGEAAAAEDLCTVEAVVEALGRCIEKRRPLWLPYWQDICVERHMRSLSLILQRHGLDLLIGPELRPVPVTGGMNQLDAAVRTEIKAVFHLDDAAMAAAGMRALGAEIEHVLAQAASAHAPAYEPPAEEEPRERHFSTLEVAALLGKSPNWVLRGLREDVFVDPDGSPIEPLRGKNNRHMFTAPMVRAIVWSAYRRGTVTPQCLEGVLAAVRNER